MMIHALIGIIVIGQFWNYAMANSGHAIRAAPVIPIAGQQAPAYAYAGAAVPIDPNQQYYQPGSVSSLTPLTVLGSACVDNFTCSALPNSYCGANHTCQCMPNFIEDPIFTGTCRLAPGYNELCASGDVECRHPFVCNSSGMCDCKSGFLQEYFQCVKDCPSGQVPVGDGCMTARQLDEKCETNEQCMQSYSQCLHNKCQCIPGTNQMNGNCSPVNQCPLGDASKDKRGKVQTCTLDNEEVCAKDFYCLHAETGSTNGFCCPKIKMNCPIGQPLEGHNCTNCPWDTHHCFSYVIGSYTETMCCPNACPAAHPIQKDGKCYAKVAYRGHCMVDEQCYNVLGTTCRKDKDGTSRCICPEGNFRNYYGRCLKEAGLGEDCTANEECKQATNTLCSNGVCTCFNGYIPEPVKGRSQNSQSQRCIAEPSCPSPAGLKPTESYTECTNDAKICKENEFCRRWWNEANHTYSLCCAKPKFTDYEAMCKPFRMKLMAVPKKTEPLRCDITSIPNQQYYVAQDSAGNSSTPTMCPTGASCLFDPYSVDKGICCKPDETNAHSAAIPLGQNPASQSIRTGSVNKTSSTGVTVAAPVGSIRTVQSVGNISSSTASSSSTPNFGPKSEEFEEEETNTKSTSQKTSTLPTVPIQTSTTASAGRVIQQMSTQSNASPKATNVSNIPVVRIRGFSNQQG